MPTIVDRVAFHAMLVELEVALPVETLLSVFGVATLVSDFVLKDAAAKNAETSSSDVRLTHWFLSQSYVGGQHPSPHVSSCCGFKMWSALPGTDRAFCAVRSQLPGSIWTQSKPGGQQKTAVKFALRGTDFILVGQQKLFGK